MRYSSDDALMAKCKGLDFSVDSANYDKNLEILKGKLANINEERCSMKEIRKIRKPLAILVAVVALMTMSVATLVASPALRNRVVRAVQFEDGTIVVSTTHEVEVGDGSYASSRVRVSEADGVMVVEHEDGTIEEITIYNAEDLCPDDELLNSSFSNRPDHALGLEVLKVYTSNACDEVVQNMIGAGYGVVQIGDYTIFYQKTDDYGIVNGAAVVEADGSVYFVAECGERELMFRP